ncbi:MAG: TlpA family protein disulfide reductase [Gammaproteobacteria bacterium]|nr:TlpA family protein disulfide reductase [Gammaproteobacteria bacterium]
MIRFYIFLFLLSIPQITLLAAKSVELEIELDSNVVLDVSHFAGSSSRLLIWLPSEQGISRGISPVAEKLSAFGPHIWLMDLHSSYMVPTSRHSLSEFPVEDLLELLNRAEREGYDEIYLLSAGRGAKLVLDTIYEFYTDNLQSNLLKGSILIHPNLFTALPVIGQKASFIPAAGTSHLPIYLIQAEYSTKYVYTQEMRSQLESGGSAVFLHLLADVESGFYGRPESELDDSSLSARRKLPEMILQAMVLLSKIPEGQPPEVRQYEKKPEVVAAVREPALGVYRADGPIPALTLGNLQGRQVSLNDFRGKVVLLNFWASWCGPCVDEIPSLARLGLKLKEKPFEILTVNIGESRERVVQFLQDVNVNFPVLLDESGKAVRDWRVYAFPSNFLIDQRGQIRYAYSGALEWDSAVVIETIESLF